METMNIIHLKSRATSGSPRGQAELREQGKQVSRARVTRLMKAAGLTVHCKRNFRTTTNSAHRHPIANHLLAREFTAAKPNQNWATDITSVPTQEGGRYLAVIMELLSRKVSGWAMRATVHTDLVLAALSMAQQHRQPAEGVLHPIQIKAFNTPVAPIGRPGRVSLRCRACAGKDNAGTTPCWRAFFQP